MKRQAAFAIAVLLLMVATSVITYAATVKSYQVTGPVKSITNDMIVVDKDGSPWEIARDSSTKVPADVKVGTKVTVFYRMTATTVEVPKAAAPKKKK